MIELSKNDKATSLLTRPGTILSFNECKIYQLSKIVISSNVLYKLPWYVEQSRELCTRENNGEIKTVFYILERWLNKFISDEAIME